MYENVRIDWEDILEGFNRIKKRNHKTVKSMLISLYAKEQTLVKTGDVLGVSSQTVCNEMARLNISRLPKGHRGKSKCIRAILALGDVSQMTTLQIAKAIDFSHFYVAVCLRKEKIEHRRGH